MMIRASRSGIVVGSGSATSSNGVSSGRLKWMP